MNDGERDTLASLLFCLYARRRWQFSLDFCFNSIFTEGSKGIKARFDLSLKTITILHLTIASPSNLFIYSVTLRCSVFTQPLCTPPCQPHSSSISDMPHLATFASEEGGCLCVHRYCSIDSMLPLRSPSFMSTPSSSKMWLWTSQPTWGLHGGHGSACSVIPARRSHTTVNWNSHACMVRPFVHLHARDLIPCYHHRASTTERGRPASRQSEVFSFTPCALQEGIVFLISSSAARSTQLERHYDTIQETNKQTNKQNPLSRAVRRIPRRRSKQQATTNVLNQ